MSICKNNGETENVVNKKKYKRKKFQEPLTLERNMESKISFNH